MRKPIRSPITRIGTKTTLLPILYSVFPKEFKRFIEVFGGSGAVLLGHDPVDFEVYNDVDEIKGGSFPVVICNLENGEKMITEKGSMAWMSPNMQMETHGGGLGRMFSKAFSGESMFQNHYTARGGAGMIAFTSSFPGEIKVIDIAPGQEMIVQKSAFLAAEAGVNLSIHFQKRLGTGFFGGEGFIMQRLSGRGTAFVEIDGDLMEYNLKPGQQIVVDTGNVAGFEPSVQMDIQTVSGAKNMLFGGEGIFNTVLTGPGRVWLQTMPIYNVANAIRPYIPASSN